MPPKADIIKISTVNVITIEFSEEVYVLDRFYNESMRINVTDKGDNLLKSNFTLDREYGYKETIT
jgi:hypothetical protein